MGKVIKQPWKFFCEEFVTSMQCNEVSATSVAGIFHHAMEFNSEIRAQMHCLREKEGRSEAETEFADLRIPPNSMG